MYMCCLLKITRWLMHVVIFCFIVCFTRHAIKKVVDAGVTFMVCFTTRSHVRLVVGNPYYIHHTL